MAGKRLYVGVTGHRPNRMPESQWARIKADLSTVMAEIESANPGRRLLLLSGIAEGADRLAAFVALGRGWPLRSVLAFHRTRFEADFPEPFAIGEFRALLAASEKIEEPRKGAYEHSPNDGYHAVGRRLIARSDVLIAIWDGQGSRGKGGTVDVIEQARAEGVMVIWLHATEAKRPKMLRASSGGELIKKPKARQSKARPA